MPGIGGGDNLSPEYAPWAWIGAGQKHFVWQTAKSAIWPPEESAEEDRYLYRAGKIGGNIIVCERRPIEDAPDGKLTIHERVEDVPVELIPQGLFPYLISMDDALAAAKARINQIDPTMSGSDQLAADIQFKNDQ